MTKLKLLLLTLMVALKATACAGGARQETAAATATDALKPAATQPATAAMPQETLVAAEQAIAASEAQASKPAQTPVASDTPVTAVLPVIGPAPGWDNEVWINSEAALPLEELQGKVVLLEFWTFG